MDAFVSVYLFPSGNYAVAYEERTPSCVNVHGECSYSKTLELYQEGTWSESGGTISLPGFGVATVVDDALQLTVTDSRVSASAQDHVFSLKYSGTSVVAYTLARMMDYDGYSSTIPEVRDAVYR